MGGDLDFIWKTLLEGMMEVAFLDKEGREFKKHQNDIKHPLHGICPDKRLCLYAFSDWRHTFKTVDLCMVIGIDIEIEPLLEEWRMDLLERGIKIRKKPGPLVHTCDKWMTLGVPTGILTSMAERQLAKMFVDAEDQTR